MRNRHPFLITLALVAFSSLAPLHGQTSLTAAQAAALAASDPGGQWGKNAASSNIPKWQTGEAVNYDWYGPGGDGPGGFVWADGYGAGSWHPSLAKSSPPASAGDGTVNYIRPPHVSGGAGVIDGMLWVNGSGNTGQTVVLTEPTKVWFYYEATYQVERGSYGYFSYPEGATPRILAPSLLPSSPGADRVTVQNVTGSFPLASAIGNPDGFSYDVKIDASIQSDHLTSPSVVRDVSGDPTFTFPRLADGATATPAPASRTISGPYISRLSWNRNSANPADYFTYWYETHWVYKIRVGPVPLTMRAGTYTRSLSAALGPRQGVMMYFGKDFPDFPGDPRVKAEAKAKMNAAGSTFDHSVTAFPTIAAEKSPNRFAYPGQPLVVQIKGTGTGCNIDTLRYVAETGNLDVTTAVTPANTVTKEFPMPAPAAGDKLRAIAMSGALKGKSTPVAINAYALRPLPLPAGAKQVATWPECDTGEDGKSGGAPDQPWEITADYHHFKGETPPTVDYGLDFTQRQYRRQQWCWVVPGIEVPLAPTAVPAPYALPAETINQPGDSLVPALPATRSGPIFQRQVSRWDPGVKPVAPVTTTTDLELNAGAKLGTGSLAIAWRNPWSVENRPDNWSGWSGVTALQMRRSTNIIAPTGKTQLSLVRREDGMQIEAKEGDVIPAGTWAATATYTPSTTDGDDTRYAATTANFTVRVNPRLVVEAENATVEYSTNGGATWAPWNNGTYYQQTSGSWVSSSGNVPSITLRATPAKTYGWGSSWDETTPEIWHFSPSADAGDSPANFSLAATGTTTTVTATLPRAINTTTMRAIGGRVLPRMTTVAKGGKEGIKIGTLKNRSSSTGLSAPWAYLCRDGLTLTLSGQSRDAGINGFELQYQTPGTTTWTTLTEATFPSASSPMAVLTATSPTFQLGTTRSQEGLTCEGANLLPSERCVEWGGVPPAYVPWAIRARCRDTLGVWSDWQDYQLNVMLPLTAVPVDTKTVAPSGPAGLWFKDSPTNTEPIYIWIE